MGIWHRRNAPNGISFSKNFMGWHHRTHILCWDPEFWGKFKPWCLGTEAPAPPLLWPTITMVNGSAARQVKPVWEHWAKKMSSICSKSPLLFNHCRTVASPGFRARGGHTPVPSSSSSSRPPFPSLYPPPCLLPPPFLPLPLPLPFPWVSGGCSPRLPGIRGINPRKNLQISRFCAF
jgi:hypothetical protein